MTDELPPRPPGSPYTDSEWRDVITIVDQASARVLTVLQQEVEVGANMNPQVAGAVLVLAMGRLAGRYGFRHLGAHASWKACTDDVLEPLFRRGFRFERSSEH